MPTLTDAPVTIPQGKDQEFELDIRVSTDRTSTLSPDIQNYNTFVGCGYTNTCNGGYSCLCTHHC